jgi:hypothetical protein
MKLRKRFEALAYWRAVAIQKFRSLHVVQFAMTGLEMGKNRPQR